MAVADACIEIPQFGTKHSLNVAVSAGIVLWEFSKNQFTGQNK
jgi:tRNA G18 (ribose-2'-O)-methylase SpoU